MMMKYSSVGQSLQANTLHWDIMIHHSNIKVVLCKELNKIEVIIFFGRK